MSRTAGVDVGGTFTDAVVLAGDLRPRAVKVPTTPDDQSVGVADALRAGGADHLESVAHGTTTATNAVLERDVARTVLVVTDGFRDLLEIGRQDRPSLYDLAVTRPAPLVGREHVVTVRERIAADSTTVVVLTDDEIVRVADQVAALEPEAIAICLLFSFVNPAHEERLATALADLGVPVTRSSVLAPEFREYERASTCVLNAAVAPVMGRYLNRLDERVGDARVTVMTSGGRTAGLAQVAAAPVLTLLSGPAAGVVAAGRVAETSGFPDAIAFDMGGTSTDVCLVRDGRPALTTSGRIDGLPFTVPTVEIVTVGAGGGSIAAVDAGGALRVGPRSAGARPGPACYGLGGSEPTVTDAHAVLGHLDPGRELGGGLALDVDAAADVVGNLPASAEGAHGILTVVRAAMARALRRVSTERGVDPSGLALVAYGGAGPMHASALARELGCAAVVIPPAPGVLSALGLLLARRGTEVSRTVLTELSDERRAAALQQLEGVWKELEDAARAELGRQVAGHDITLTRVADCRYRGQSHELRIVVEPGDDLSERLHAAHEEAYGYALPTDPVEVVTIRVVAEAEPALAELPTDWDQGEPSPERERRVVVGGEAVTARIIDRAGLSPGDEIDGPALVEQSDTTTILAPGDRAVVDDAQNLVIRRPADG